MQSKEWGRNKPSRLFVPLISKQTPFRLEDDPTDPFRICGEQRHHRRHRSPICSVEKSASRTGLINVNHALSEIAQSTSARFMMKTLRIIAFTYNVYHDNVITFTLLYYSVIIFFNDFSLVLQNFHFSKAQSK